MKTSRVVLNDRTKKPKSAFHRICTYEHSPHFESEEPHGYEFSHSRTPAQQLVFHKEEIIPTPISLPTPPASAEFWGTSLHKWYQKKPLFTLTAKGQVKRLEKYLQIQKTIEICKKEHEFQVQTENMRKAYVDFEFREHQPLLFEDKDVCCVCPCNSSRKYDVDFIPVDYVSCSTPKSKYCICPNEDEMFENVAYEMQQESKKKDINNEEINTSFIQEQRIRPTKIIKQGQKDPKDRGIYKIIVKNKEVPETPNAKYVMKIYDNENFDRNETIQYATEKTNGFQDIPNQTENYSKSGLSRITVGNVTPLPFDIRNYQCRSPKKAYCSNISCSCCIRNHFDDMKEPSCFYGGKYDMNRNEIN